MQCGELEEHFIQNEFLSKTIPDDHPISRLSIKKTRLVGASQFTLDDSDKILDKFYGKSNGIRSVPEAVPRSDK